MDVETAAGLVIAKINERQSDDHLLVAIDGRSGAGKSTLANLLAEKAGAVVVLGDDFYSGGSDEKWQKYSSEERAAAAIDWKRLRDVLELLLAGKPASWHPLAFEPGKGWTGWKSEFVTLKPARIIVLDGAYSSRPELANMIDLTVLVESPEDVRRKRLLAREGAAFMKGWHQIWDAAEDYYFSQVRPRSTFELVIQLE